MSKNDAFKNGFLLKEFLFLKWPSILKSMIKKTNILESNLFTTRALLHNQSIIPSTGVIQLTLTVKMKVPIPNPDQVNLVFDPLLPFFVLFFKTMFVSFFNLRIIL